jgi:hypothetical protein
MGINTLNLGIVYHQSEDGLYYMTGHRSLLKVMLNPVLRIFKWQIGSIVKTLKTKDPNEFKIDSLKLDKIEKRVFNFSKSWFFILEEKEKIHPKRRWS